MNDREWKEHLKELDEEKDEYVNSHNRNTRIAFLIAIVFLIAFLSAFEYLTK